MSSSVLALEHAFIKVPYESLQKNFRSNQKVLEREATALHSQLADLVANAQKGSLTVQDAAAGLEAIAGRLASARGKMEEVLREEEGHTERCRVRLAHLGDEHAERTQQWNETRLDRIMVDFLLREGCYEAASQIARDSNIESLVDIRVFIESRRIEEALARHDCTEALAWCRENGSRLKKIESTLEFRLRLQEFIELVREGRKMDAIAHAKKYLAGNASLHMGDIQRAMALLAFPPDTRCAPYKALYDKARWADLRAQFRRDNYVLHSLSTQSLVTITLQAGLSAFKTRLCYQDENKNPNCPVCVPLMNSLAERLPFSHRIHSALVCRMSGDVINDHNLPLMLPNGYVYGQRALTEMADKNNGLVTCPRSGNSYRLADCKKVFIM